MTTSSFVDQPLSNLLFSRLQTYGETQVHWVKVRVDPKSSGVFSIEQKIVRSNLLDTLAHTAGGRCQGHGT